VGGEGRRGGRIRHRSSFLPRVEGGKGGRQKKKRTRGSFPSVPNGKRKKTGNAHSFLPSAPFLSWESRQEKTEKGGGREGGKSRRESCSTWSSSLKRGSGQEKKGGEKKKRVEEEPPCPVHYPKEEDGEGERKEGGRRDDQLSLPLLSEERK